MKLSPFVRRFTVGPHDRGFLFQNGRYVRALRPGVHWVLGFGWSLSLVEAGGARLPEGENLDILLKDPVLAPDLAVFELRDHERALVWAEGRLVGVVSGRGAYWKVVRPIKVEVVDARSVRFQHDSLDSVVGHKDAASQLEVVVVGVGCVGLWLVDEKVREELPPGRYAFWKGVARSRVEVVDQRETPLELVGQEVLTKDKATVRLTVLSNFQVTDARKWAATIDARGEIYRAQQLAARIVAGARTLDELLAQKDGLGPELTAHVLPRARSIGATVSTAGVRDLTLPGEMRTLMNQVIEAEKRAQANLITRREETAATRALLNTAKLYEEHPLLLRIKEIETAERLAEKVKELRVGSLDELLVRLLPGQGRSGPGPGTGEAPKA